MKKTENKELIETMEFDNYAYAKQIFDDSGKKLGRIKIGLIVSAVVSVLSVVGFLLQSRTLIGSELLGVAFVGAIAAYIIGGGFKTVLKAVKKLAFFGWVILPFPADLITGCMTLILAPVIFFLFPIVFVLINYKQVKNNRDDAEEYMRFCNPIETSASSEI